MSQTRLQSLKEQITQIAVGLTINFTANMIIFPLFGWEITTSQNIALGIIYTGISLVRGYCIRRYYNWRH